MKTKVVSISLFFLLAVLSAGAWATPKRDFRFMGIGGRLSYVNPEDLDGTFGFGAHADLGDIIPYLAFYPSITYWSSSLDVTGFNFSFSEIGLNGDVHYNFHSHENWRPYLGGGLGIFYTRMEDIDSDVDLGLNVLGGVETKISRKTKGFLQGRVKFDGFDTLKLTAGFTVEVGKKGPPVSTIHKGKKHQKQHKKKIKKNRR